VVRPITSNLTCPIAIRALWELSRNDWTRRQRVRSFSRRERVCVDLTWADHCAVFSLGTMLRLVVITVGSWLIAVGIMHAALNEETMWTAQSDRMLSRCVRSL
jgi:hypothetical protein